MSNIWIVFLQPAAELWLAAGLVLNKPGGILMETLKPEELERAKEAGTLADWGRRGEHF